MLVFKQEKTLNYSIACVEKVALKSDFHVFTLLHHSGTPLLQNVILEKLNPFQGVTFCNALCGCNLHASANSFFIISSRKGFLSGLLALVRGKLSMNSILSGSWRTEAPLFLRKLMISSKLSFVPGLGCT